MPGPRGGTSKPSEWRNRKRKTQAALDAKHKRAAESPLMPSEETQSSCETQKLLNHESGTESMSACTSTEAELGTDLTHNYLHTKELMQESPLMPSEETQSSCGTQKLLDHENGTGSMSVCTNTEAELGTDLTHNYGNTKDRSLQTESVNVLESSSESSFNSSSDEEDFVAYYLEEENEENVDDPAPIGADPDDPGLDPDDDGDDGDDGVPEASDSEEDSDEDANDANFHLNDPTLDVPLHVGRLRTKKETLLLQLGLSVQHNWDYESLINNMKAFNLAIGRNNLPTNKKQLWRILHRNAAGIQYHAYCRQCSHYLGRLGRLVAPVVCGGCGLENDLQRVKCFITLSVKKQLENFLSKPGAFELLQYRQRRVKRREDCIEDVYDGEAYRNLQRDGGVLSNILNFSFILNTDGFLKSTSAHLKMWPVLLRLNELPPNLRQKHMFLAGIWVDRKIPNSNAFLTPIVRQLNKLAIHGVNWTPHNGDVMVNSKFVCLGFTADAEGRALLLNMQKWNGTYGCTFCLHQTNNSKYHVPDEGQPWPNDRTDADMRRDMDMEHGPGDDHFRGHKGATELRNLRHFDLRTSNTMDDLHPIYLGVTKFHTELLLNLPGNVEQRVRIINHRLNQVKTPTSISRKPQPISKRAKYHGTEWRNWLLFYGPVCLTGQIPARYLNHFGMLSHAVFLLSQDSISPEDIDRAEELIDNYIMLFQEYFGPNNMRYSVHVLRHLGRSVRENGNLWAYSTFNFESWNHRILLYVTSPKDSMIQMTTKHLLCSLVYQCAYDEDIDETVRNFLQSLLFKGHKNAVRAGRAVLLGRQVNNRAATNEEANLMEQEEIPVAHLCLYERVLVGGAEYRVPQYNPGGLSDNTLVYTDKNTFCRITSIATVQDEDGEDQCILFVEEIDIVQPLPFAQHIAEMREGGELPHVIRAESIISPVVKVTQGGSVYLVPLATVNEID